MTLTYDRCVFASTPTRSNNSPNTIFRQPNFKPRFQWSLLTLLLKFGITTFCATMNMTKKIVLALAALTVASFPLVIEGCNGHANHHHHHAHDDQHLQNADEDCSEDSAHDGFSNSVVDRRLELESVTRCSTPEPSQTMLREMPSIMTRWKERVRGDRRLQTEIINIPVYFHIIKPSDGSEGEVSAQQIQNQIIKMNDAYAGHFAFTLQDTDTTLNSRWYGTNAGNVTDIEMKTALKVDGINTLNIYTVKPPQSSLGWVSCVMSCLSCCFMLCAKLYPYSPLSIFVSGSHSSFFYHSLFYSFLKGYISSWNHCRQRPRWRDDSVLHLAWW
jgi:hypothetical protein